jgi:hypothetical protein
MWTPHAWRSDAVLECTMHNARVERYLEDLRLLSEDRYALVSRLRHLILDVGTDVTDDIKYGGILFSASAPFCGIFSYQKHVSIEFSRGADLPDKRQVLEGEGKLRRHIKIESLQDLLKKSVREYVVLAHGAATASPDTLGRARR